MGLPQTFSLFKKNVISEKCNKAELNNAFYSYKLESVKNSKSSAHWVRYHWLFKRLFSFDLHFTSLENYLANWINCLIILMDHSYPEPLHIFLSRPFAIDDVS